MSIKKTVKLTFTKAGLDYVVSRLPHIMVWTVISTITITSVQFLAYDLLPVSFFVRYDQTATAKDIKLGDAPVVHYCRESNDSYSVVLSGQLIKLDPPVYKKQYYIYAPIEKGRVCLDRESVVKPDLPGKYQMYYTAEITLPFGVKRYQTFLTNGFEVTEDGKTTSDNKSNGLDTIKMYNNE